MNSNFIKCPGCGKSNASFSRRCSGCGAGLHSIFQQPTGPAQPEPPIVDIDPEIDVRDDEATIESLPQLIACRHCKKGGLWTTTTICPGCGQNPRV